MNMRTGTICKSLQSDVWVWWVMRSRAIKIDILFVLIDAVPVYWLFTFRHLRFDLMSNFQNDVHVEVLFTLWVYWLSVWLVWKAFILLFYKSHLSTNRLKWWTNTLFICVIKLQWQIASWLYGAASLSLLLSRTHKSVTEWVGWVFLFRSNVIVMFMNNKNIANKLNNETYI